MPEEKFPVSVIIHTKNSAETLQSCLESVQFAEEVLVIDMESTDDTKKIAEHNSARVITVKDEGYGYADPVRNFGLEQAKKDWILVVDSDEVVSEGLATWIQRFLENGNKSVAAFRVPRRNFIFGQEIQHTGWWPDYQIRFFRNGKVQWVSEVHGVPRVEGQIENIPEDRELAFIHNNYPTVEKFVERMNRYTTATAKEKVTQQNPNSTFESSLIESFSQEFNRRMFEWKGVNDGGVGVGLSFLQSTYELLVELKAWELKGMPQTSNPLSTIQALNTFSRELRYWIADWHIKNSTGFTKLIWRIKRKLQL